jgi:asparagine synthase (glutamine-hydrolysing)
MCGIWALFGKHVENPEQYINKLKNRGPEETKIITEWNYQLGFTRLAINGLSEGSQPSQRDGMIWMCNGEIYNHIELSKRFNIANLTGSDCDILGKLCRKKFNFPTLLDGVFSLVIVDKNTVTVARDPYGVRPLFMYRSDERIIFSSELKAFPNDPKAKITVFPPGHFINLDLKTLYYNMYTYHYIPELPIVNDVVDAVVGVRNLFINSVMKRLMTERPVAALLSGGLDSSLVCAILQKFMKIKLKTFSIGFQGSEDLRCAKIVADFIGSDHTEIIMTPDDFFHAIPDVIKDIESYDITTVRASVGNWLIAKEIRNRTECKVVFNGDGSDELFGGYLYFHKSPTETDFMFERDRILQDIHYFDVLRSDRCISSHGLEPRTPFLDKELVAFVKRVRTTLLRPTDKQCEKWLLRTAFKGFLPDEILWRKKEAFSDGVSSSGNISWYQECQERTNKIVPDWNTNFEHLPPISSESFYYRKIYDSMYSYPETIPYFWMPKWSPETKDPSARTLT